MERIGEWRTVRTSSASTACLHHGYPFVDTVKTPSHVGRAGAVIVVHLVRHRSRMAAFLASMVLMLTACVAVRPDALDPDAPNIVPRTGADAAIIETKAPADSTTPGVEGSILFVRLADENGGVVLDTPFSFPVDEQPVPAGRYSLAVYWRGCDGHCGHLSGEDVFCQEDITLRARERVTVLVEPSQFFPGSTCSLER